MARVPSLVAFDLDDTLWSPEMWLCSGPPWKTQAGRVYDRSGTEIELIGASQRVLHELATQAKWEGTRVGYASRTDHPKWAMECLRKIEVGGGITMDNVRQPLFEIYPGRKTAHFAAFHKATGIPYADMIFFDNENRNCIDVAPLGVTCIYTPDGLTKSKWDEGLAIFASARRS